jgi:hypothetical protein
MKGYAGNTMKEQSIEQVWHSSSSLNLYLACA